MKSLIFLLAVMGGLTACSVEMDGDKAGPAPQEEVFENKVPGPQVEGAWISGCLFDAYQNAYKIRHAAFKGQNVQRGVNFYKDSACSQLTKKEELKGVFRWSETTSYGGYQVDYRFDLGQGITSLSKEEILIENNIMYLSDFRVGFGRIDKSVPMKLLGGSDTPPSPTPAPPEKSCPDFNGIYRFERTLTAVSQNECTSMNWQVLNSDLSPNGRPDVFQMDKVPRQSGSSTIASYYLGDAFVLDVQTPGSAFTVFKFKIEDVSEACGQGFGMKKKMLVRRGYINNIEYRDYCAYWEKVK